ncbi:MAG: UDP-3-O-(3-hydroxymyristoyl)glucosamine N-acyltransferase [Planctomycetes bacterium]|nr:UDP-3-O-(3-hydroxymyristoyl)glucosamine N-acyltransferase [Planctomycetota bacterium]
MRCDDVAARVGGELVQGDAALEVVGLAALDEAGPADLTFSERDDERLGRCRAGCVLAPRRSVHRPAGSAVIEVDRPKVAFARAASLLLASPRAAGRVHPTAVVDPAAVLAPDVEVGPYVVIEAGVRVGRGSWIGAHAHLGEGASIGEECRLHPRVTLYPGARVGDRVVLHAGVVVGGDGFGYVVHEGRHLKFPQAGSVVIEDDVEVGCNTTVDRGSLGTTRVGRGTRSTTWCRWRTTSGSGSTASWPRTPPSAGARGSARTSWRAGRSASATT